MSACLFFLLYIVYEQDRLQVPFYHLLLIKQDIEHRLIFLQQRIYGYFLSDLCHKKAHTFDFTLLVRFLSIA